MPFVTAQAKLLVDLFTVTQAWETGGGTGIIINLFKTAVVPNPQSTAGSFVVADFDGYAAQVVAPPLGAAFAKGIDQAQQYIDSIVSFIPTGSTTPNTIYGYWLEDRAGNYIGAEAFQTPQNVSGPSHPLHFVLVIALQQYLMSAIITP